MKRYYRDSDGTFKESASEQFLMHSTGKWDRSKTKYVKIVKSPSGRDAYLYPDDLEPGKKYGPKVGEAKADESKEEEKQEVDEHGLTAEQRYGKGNIDLYARPVFQNDDGSISTVDSFSVNIDGKEVLLPSIGRDSDGKPVRLSEDEAIAKYKKDGQHLGKFDTVEEANAYAKKLHEDQERIYSEYAKQLKRSSNGQGQSGKIAVVGAGGKEYGRFDSAKDALDFVKGKKKPELGDAVEVKKGEEAKEQASIRSGSSNSSSSSAASTTSKPQVSTSSHLTTPSSKEARTSISKDVAKQKAVQAKEQKEAAKKKATTTAQISLNTDSNSSSSATTRGLFGNSNSSSSSTIKPEHLKAKPGQTSATDTAKGKNTTAENRPKGRETTYSFEKKSGAKQWHVKEGTVGKNEALNNYKQVGNNTLDEFLKKVK